LILFLGFFQTIHQRSSGKETHLTPLSAGGQSQPNRQVRFSRALTADQAKILMVFDPLAPSGFQYLLFVQGRYHAEVIGVEIFVRGEGRLFDAALERIGRSLGYFQFHQAQEILGIIGVLLGGFGGQLLVLGQDHRQS